MKIDQKKDNTPKLKDIAEKAGVSPTTATMVFNDTGRISEKTRQRVLSVAEELGYRHHKRKKSAIKTGSHVALLLMIDKDWSFIWHFLIEMIQQIDEDLRQYGLKTAIIPISHHDDDLVIYQKIYKLGCKAVFSIHFGREKLFQKLENEGFPVILIMNNNYQDQHFSICVDDFQGAYEGTRHLLQLGHKQIYFVDTNRNDLPILSTDRYYGFRKAQEENGIVFRNEHRLICNLDSSKAELDSYFLKAISQPNPPTALFCLDDEIALVVWHVLNRLGYSIPDDFSIIAPGDVLDYSKPYIPPITTMKIDMKYVGRLAVDMLANRLNNDIKTVHVLKVKQQLIERGSCRSNQ